jgi:hypothetical protein
VGKRSSRSPETDVLQIPFQFRFPHSYFYPSQFSKMGQVLSRPSRVEGDEIISRQQMLDTTWAAAAFLSEAHQTEDDGTQHQNAEGTICQPNSGNKDHANSKFDDTEWGVIGDSQSAVSSLHVPDMKERFNDSVREFLHGKIPATFSPEGALERKEKVVGTKVSGSNQSAVGPGNLGERLRNIVRTIAFSLLCARLCRHFSLFLCRCNFSTNTSRLLNNLDNRRSRTVVCLPRKITTTICSL